MDRLVTKGVRLLLESFKSLLLIGMDLVETGSVPVVEPSLSIYEMVPLQPRYPEWKRDHLI